MNAPAQTPATPSTATEKSKDSALAAFVKSLDPKAKPNKSDQKAAAAAFKAFQAKRKEALAALKALDLEEGEVARACIRAFGKTQLTSDGTTFAPTSRDERIYY